MNDSPFRFHLIIDKSAKNLSRTPEQKAMSAKTIPHGQDLTDFTFFHFPLLESSFSPLRFSILEKKT